MKILVTGAAGTIGLAVIKSLLDEYKDFELSLFELPSTKNRRRLKKFSDKAKIIWGDIRRKEDIEYAVKGVDYVIHLAAIIPPLADKNVKLAWEVNVEGTRNLLEGLRRYSPGAMVIYSSSVAVYGDRLSRPWIKVGDELRPSEGDYYAQTKIVAEDLIRSSGLKWTIFRVSAVFGVKNHKISGLMFHMPLSTPIEIITPEDAGRAFAKAVGKSSQLEGRIFNLGGGQSCRIIYKDFLERAFALYGLGPVKFPVTAFATKNFHCGFFEDSDELEEILQFRRDSIDSYFKRLKERIRWYERMSTQAVAPIVRFVLLMKSEPYRALLKGEIKKLRRFYGLERIGSDDKKFDN